MRERKIKPITSNVTSARTLMAAQKRTDQENAAGLRSYIEDRWKRGIPRDYTAPDLWGDGLSGGRRGKKK